jgi:hypothetical protein
MHAGGVEGGAVVRHVVVGVAQRPLHALQLQRLQFVAAGAFDRLQIGRRGVRWTIGVSSLDDGAADAVRLAAEQGDGARS